MMRPADVAHGILPWLGLIVAMQAPITAWVISAGAPVKLVDLGFGAVGLALTAWSKHIDSVSYTTIRTQAPQHPAAPIAPQAIQAPSSFTITHVPAPPPAPGAPLGP